MFLNKDLLLKCCTCYCIKCHVTLCLKFRIFTLERVKRTFLMEKGSIAIRVRKLLIENGFDREQADVLAMVLDDIYHSQMDNAATKEDIKMLMQMMDKRFEAVNKRFEELLHYVDKRFEAVDKRFEDMNKRLTFIQWLIAIMFTVYTAIVTFVVTYVLPNILG